MLVSDTTRQYRDTTIFQTVQKDSTRDITCGQYNCRFWTIQKKRRKGKEYEIEILEKKIKTRHPALA